MGSPTLYYGVVPDIIRGILTGDWNHLIQFTLPGAIGEAVSKATFENYYHATVTTNWGQPIWGGPDFTVNMNGNTYKLEAKGTWSYDYVDDRLRDGHTDNLNGESGYVTCYLIPDHVLYKGWYS